MNFCECCNRLRLHAEERDLNEGFKRIYNPKKKLGNYRKFNEMIPIVVRRHCCRSSLNTSNQNQEKPGSNLKSGELGNCDVSSIPDTNTKSDVEDSNYE